MGKMDQALKKAVEARGDKGAAAGRAGAGTASAFAIASQLRTGDLDPNLVVLGATESPQAEGYRRLKGNLKALAPEVTLQVMVVTSAVEGEGKTVTAANLACVFAEEEGRQVVLVDADFRNPRLHELLIVDNQHGLSDYLQGGTMLEMVLQRSRLPNLWVIPAGRAPSDPVELFDGKRAEDLVARLRRDYDYVIIDTPAISEYADAGLLGPKTDGALLVVRLNHTDRDHAKKGHDMLRQAGVKVVGCVVSDV